MKTIKGISNASVFRERKKQMYINKYFNLYMNRYKFSGDIDYQQIDFILRKFWRDGAVAMFPLRAEKGKGEVVRSEQHPNGEAVFTPFAPNGWNIYDWPVSVNLINTKGVPFIPVGEQVVDEDVVIGYIQRNKKGVAEFVENIVDDIVTAEMVIYINLNSHKMPWLIAVDPESEKKMKDLYNKLKNDEPELFIASDEAKNFKALTSGATYIIDKLYNYKMARENELREFFGQNNVGVGEKKEHLISDEVQANDQLVATSEGCLIDPLKEFFERGRKTFGFDIDVEIREVEQMNTSTMTDEEMNEEDEQDE